MEGLEEWNTAYSSVEDGVEDFMFPVLHTLAIRDCPRLRLKPCLPTLERLSIRESNQVISSLEEIDKTSHYYYSSTKAMKLDLDIGDSCQSIRLFHHFPALRDLRIHGPKLTSVPEGIQRLSYLKSLKLIRCDGIQALPEWLGDLSSLESLVIKGRNGIKSLPACIQQLTKLEKLEIWHNQELKEWCESEENKAKLAHINVQVFDDDEYYDIF